MNIYKNGYSNQVQCSVVEEDAHERKSSMVEAGEQP